MRQDHGSKSCSITRINASRFRVAPHFEHPTAMIRLFLFVTLWSLIASPTNCTTPVLNPLVTIHASENHRNRQGTNWMHSDAELSICFTPAFNAAWIIPLINSFSNRSFNLKYFAPPIMHMINRGDGIRQKSNMNWTNVLGLVSMSHRMYLDSLWGRNPQALVTAGCVCLSFVHLEVSPSRTSQECSRRRRLQPHLRSEPVVLRGMNVLHVRRRILNVWLIARLSVSWVWPGN